MKKSIRKSLALILAALMLLSILAGCSKANTDPIARAVKLADLRHNSDLSRLNAVDEKALRRVEKYAEAIRLLTGE